jgi:undecaprenyl-diphosphatase
MGIGASDPGTLDPAMAALLGALQGVTEFLPISSSGHLSLAQAWLGIDAAAAGHRFNIVVHAGTLLAVVWLYRRDLWELLGAALHLRRATASRSLLVALVVGTLPLALALVPGVKTVVIAMEKRVPLVGVALLTTAALLALAGWSTRRPADGAQSSDRIRPAIALVIGLAQVTAVLPGISRSGATIATALLLGVPPAQAARFSFLLMVPAVLGATLDEAVDALEASTTGGVDAMSFAVGFVTSFVVGLAALRWLLRLVGQGRLIVFVPYLLLLGLAAIIVG